MLTLSKFSIGVGDRFAHQAGAQLKACQQLAADGVVVAPVWNKSNREHLFIGSEPSSVKESAGAAVANSDWTEPWHVDADHIGLGTVDRFLECSDFFTIDVADFIGQAASVAEIEAFVGNHPELCGSIAIAGIESPLEISSEEVERVARLFLLSVKEAGKVYRHIAAAKGSGGFIAEISMDETDSPQTPPELLIILAMIADEEIPAQTIAPKFTGRFNKGVDYVGDLDQFAKEFSDDLAVIAHAVETYGLPENLKLSVHSGSDKFSLYPIIREALQKTGGGVHLKTAGTTWLEELIGLSEAGGEGLAIAKKIYRKALENVDEYCEPYATVIDIDRSQLPPADEVDSWSGEKMASTIRHIPGHPDFNAHVRQLLHIAFKLAAKEGEGYTKLLRDHSDVVGRNVTDNLYERHLKPLFIG